MPRARAGIWSVTDVEAEDLEDAQRQREAPPESAQTANGVSSATLSVRW